MDLLYVWHDYRYWSIICFGTILTPAYDLEVKVTELEVYVKVLRQNPEDLLISKSLHGFTLYLASL